MPFARQLFAVFAPLLLVAPLACSSSTPNPGETGALDASIDSPAVGKDGATDARSDGEAGVVCCPPDPQRAGCMHMGGAAIDGQCPEACDFFCSQNWRIVKDPNGCDEWTYDYVPPGPGQGPECQPLDGGADADAAFDGGDAARD